MSEINIVEVVDSETATSDLMGALGVKLYSIYHSNFKSIRESDNSYTAQGKALVSVDIFLVSKVQRMYVNYSYKSRTRYKQFDCVELKISRFLDTTCFTHAPS